MNLSMCEPGTFQDRYGSESTCQSRVAANCEDSLGAPGTGATTTTETACTSALQSLSCTDVLAGTDPTACQPPVGTVAMGQPCSFNGQCTTQYCLVALGSICGTCQAAPQPGAACSVNGCAEGQVCVASSGTCQTAVTAVGATCSATSPCGPGLACVTVRTTMSCQALGAAVGVACAARNDLLPDCDHRLGLTCDTGSHKCVQDTYATAGNACGPTDGGYVDCENGGACNTTGAGTDGTCEAPAADGAACDPSGAAPCLVPAVCVTMTGSSVGTCELQNGASCH
jgi:hypothetical protein